MHSNWSYSSVSSDEIDPNDECISVKTLVGYKRLPIRSGASDLFSYIDLNNSVPKHNQLLIFSQIVKAVEYMHRNHFTHGDIKEENILLSDDLKVKLCDYGHSRKRQQLPRGGFINRVAFYGTKDMTSPELIPNLKNKNDTSLLERVSGFECDVWALGLLLLAMISGTLSSSHKEFLANVSSGRTFTEYPANYRDIEENDCAEVADLLKKMLNCDPNERIKMKQVIDHPWIKKASLL